MGRESSRDTTNSGVGIQAGRSDPLLGHHHESTTAGCELCGKTRLQDIYDKKIQGCTAPVITSGHPGRTGQKARRQKAKRGRQKANREGNKDTKNDRHYVEHINREWQLDGLSKQQKDTIRAGEHPSLWTAPALGLKMATRLRLLLDKLKRLTDTNYSGGSHRDHVLMPTAGAGGTTIAMSLVFENVSAGDFCPAQLAALRHNICGVMHLDGVSVDKKPMNLLTRPDLSQYTAIAIEPLWGGSKFSEAPEGKLDLFVPTGAYNKDFVNDVALGLPEWTVQKGAMPLADVVVNTMLTFFGLKGAAILVPENFNIKGFANTINEKGLMLFVVRTVGLPPADLTEGAMSRMVKLSRPINIKDMRSLKHFPKYSGPDRFILVLRKSAFFRADEDQRGRMGIISYRRPTAKHDNVDDFTGGLVINDMDIDHHAKGSVDFRDRMFQRYKAWDQSFNGSVKRSAAP